MRVVPDEKNMESLKAKEGEVVGVGCFSIQWVLVLRKCNSGGGCPSQKCNSVGILCSNRILWVVSLNILYCLIYRQTGQATSSYNIMGC